MPNLQKITHIYNISHIHSISYFSYMSNLSCISHISHLYNENSCMSSFALHGRGCSLDFTSVSSQGSLFWAYKCFPKSRFSNFRPNFGFLNFLWPFWASGGFPWPSQNPYDHFSPPNAPNRPTQTQLSPKTIFFDICFLTFPNCFEKITSHRNPQTKPVG